jgi:hypothetical protein
MTGPFRGATRRAPGRTAPTISTPVAERFSVKYGALTPTVIAVVCLGIWWLSPIYPDEIAFRQQLGRIIADGGVVHGLYELCESNVKTVPFVLRPMAWLLALTMQFLSPVEMRFLSFAAVIGVVFATACLAAGERNPIAGLVALAAFAGVAGSGLIFARYEFALEVHLLSCLIAALLLRRPTTSALLSAAIALGLIACAALSVWCHIQGLIFLPLTAYLLQRLAVRRFGAIGVGAVAFPFVLLVPPALTLHRSRCTEFPEIEAFWRKMVFDPSTLSLQGTVNWFLSKWSLHTDNFTYAANFPVRYLPEVTVQGAFVPALNIVVEFVIGLTGLSLVALLLAIPIVGFSAASARYLPSSTAPGTPRFLLTLAFLIGGPTAFLFFYDSAHSFYRSFYVQHFAAVAVALAASVIPLQRPAGVVRAIGASIALVAAISLISNAILLVPPLWRGYEGPSLSIFRDWSGTKREVEALAQQCGADLDRGRIIVDDLTQGAVFTKPITFPVTYISLQASIIGKSLPEALRLIHPNYAILQCPNFALLKVKPQTVRGGLCCLDFGGEQS